MKSWTTQAEQRLTDYLRERAAREGLQGEEAQDLQEDLRVHIHEEAEGSAAETIGLMQLENILGKLDAGYRPERLEKEVEPRKRGRFARGFAWTFGVVLPALVLMFETFTSFCGSVFFDPVPTWWHFLLIATVPITNAWFLMGANQLGERTQGIAAGIALVVACFYGLLFLPLLVPSFIALIFGIGLLSLTPILAALSTWLIIRSAKKQSADPRSFVTGKRLGVFTAAIILLAFEGPALWTRGNLASTRDGGENKEAAISRLRTFHSERTLLKACYEGSRGMAMSTDISGWMLIAHRIPFAMFGGGGVMSPTDSENNREVFFRVTGKPFNSLKPPAKRNGGALIGRVDPMEDFEFDDHLGGDDVAVRLKDLDLADSRFDGHVDSVSGIGYGEWTMVFHNGSRQQAKEARCQVRLPRDGRVSRLTLWVNGEPREAAFSTISKVKAAYKSVAVVQRRDPVLVNVVGPDTVMVQCFPVPANGDMKIRIGISAPLVDGAWEMPRIVERNFGIKSGLEHALWLQGDKAFHLSGSGEAKSSHADGDGQSLPLTLAGDAVMDPHFALRMNHPSSATEIVWCEDRFAKPEERFLIRERFTRKHSAAREVVLVIDGSASMNETRSWLMEALKQIKPGGLKIILADDKARGVTASELEKFRFSGGRDNEPALREGIRIAKDGGAPVVWIHGPQAVGLSQPEALLQLLERGAIRPVIHEIEAVSGPNRLAESVFRSGCLKRGPAMTKPAEDLARFLDMLRTDRDEPAWNWKRAAVSDGIPGRKVWDQLARLWAAEHAEDTLTTLGDDQRSELAARYQLVTSHSGAVVLETQQQYQEHGLTPADGSATPQVPSVPEPSSSMLVIVAATAALLRRRRTP